MPTISFKVSEAEAARLRRAAKGRSLSEYLRAAALPPLYWSLSRSAWIGTLAGLGATTLLLALRRSRAWFLAALVGLPLLAAAAGWTAWKTLPGVQTRVGEVLESKGESGGIRLPMWKDAPAMIRARWLASQRLWITA